MKDTFKLTNIEIPKVAGSYEIKVAGSYEITGNTVNTIEFIFNKKPKLINRLFCKWCLGWTWIDK